MEWFVAAIIGLVGWGIDEDVGVGLFSAALTLVVFLRARVNRLTKELEGLRTRQDHEWQTLAARIAELHQQLAGRAAGAASLAAESDTISARTRCVRTRCSRIGGRASRGSRACEGGRASAADRSGRAHLPAPERDSRRPSAASDVGPSTRAGAAPAAP